MGRLQSNLPSLDGADRRARARDGRHGCDDRHLALLDNVENRALEPLGSDGRHAVLLARDTH